MTKPNISALLLRRLLWALQAGLVVLIIYLLVRTVLGFVAPQSLWTDTQSAILAAPTNASQNPRAYQFGFDPFHRLEQVAEPEDLGKDAPETTLDLKLTGLRAGTNGTAFLMTPDNKQAVYKIGDEIITGVTLESVSANFIVLSLNGRLERLTFQRDQENTLVAAPQTEKLSLAQFMGSVSLNRVTDGGIFEGYKIQTKPGGIDIAQYGLRNGDVVTRIGDQDLTMGQPDFQAMMRNGSRPVAVSVLRNGRPITLTIGSR